MLDNIRVNINPTLKKLKSERQTSKTKIANLSELISENTGESYLEKLSWSDIRKDYLDAPDV